MSVKVLICWGFFFIAQNSYFGWHAIPQSDMELLADGITMILLAMAVKGGARCNMTLNINLPLTEHERIVVEIPKEPRGVNENR